MTTHTSTRGDVGIPYDDSLWHPCGAPKKDSLPCRMLVRNGYERCRWHRPARRHVGSLEALLAACGTDQVDKLIDDVILSEETSR